LTSSESQSCSGEKMIVVARKIDKQKVPCPYTHDHRAEWAKVHNGKCWVEKSWTWTGK